MAYATGLPAALARRGLKVETVPGWETRSAGSFNPKGAVCHWTAGPRGATGRPSLNVVVNGRADLAGPLCNVYLDRAGVAVVVAAGRANHAGTGGWKGLVGNSAVFGTEAESAGDGDWTVEQRWAYPRVNAAYCDLGGFSADYVCGHNEWAPDRKIDIRDWPMSGMRSSVASVLSGGDDMPLTEADKKIIYEAVWFGASGAQLIPNYHADPNGKKGEWPYTTLGWLQDRIAKESIGPMIAGLQAQIAAQTELVNQLAAPGQAVDLSKIQQAIDDSIKRSIESIVVTVNTRA